VTRNFNWYVIGVKSGVKSGVNLCVKDV
jgi:hypothetical protein